jgi:hypothetical protein
MAFPGFNHLYVIGDPMANRPFRGGWKSNDSTFGLLRAEIGPLTPPVIPWFMGGAVPGDIIWTGMATPLMVSQRVIEVLHDANLTGWQTYTVIVKGKDGEICPGYCGLAITGRCGQIDLEHSDIIIKEFPGGWFPHFKGEYFPSESWDGSDFFMEEASDNDTGNGFIYATSKVVKAFAKAKIKNIRFTRMDEIVLDTYIFETGNMRAKLPADFEQRVDAAYCTAGVPKPK